VESPLPGLVLRTYKKPGDKVAVGETVLVLESMKMETPINSGFSGIIADLSVHQGHQVEAGQTLFKVNTIAHGSMQTVARAAEAQTKAVAPNLLGAVGERVSVESPLPGLVLRIYKEPGERIRAGESILVLESMKMETPINSAVDGFVDALSVKQGDQIQAGQVLAVIRK
jgi:biotin carboxyl carrier protein